MLYNYHYICIINFFVILTDSLHLHLYTSLHFDNSVVINKHVIFMLLYQLWLIGKENQKQTKNFNGCISFLIVNVNKWANATFVFGELHSNETTELLPCIIVHGFRVVRCRTCDREVTGTNPALGCSVPTPTQRAIPSWSVNEYQQKLGSKRAYHAIHCLRMRGLAASADVWLRAKETEISAALWALRPGNGLYFALLISLL